VRARDAFTLAQLRLQAAGCRYRIKEVALLLRADRSAASGGPGPLLPGGR
jgi:hypothetical protein